MQQEAVRGAEEWTHEEWMDWYLQWGYAEHGRASWSDDEWQEWAFAQLAADPEAPATPGDLMQSTGRQSALPPSPSGSEAAVLDAAARAAEQERALAVTLDFGKYKGQTLRAVRTTDPAYVRWMATKAFCRAKPELKAGLVACGVLDAAGTVPVTRVACVDAPPPASASPPAPAAMTAAEACRAMLIRLKTGPLAELADRLDADIAALAT